MHIDRNINMPILPIVVPDVVTATFRVTARLSCGTVTALDIPAMGAGAQSQRLTG
jgi:hypothetical protein